MTDTKKIDKDISQIFDELKDLHLNLIDAAEFEARVAAKLARKDFDGSADIRCSRCPSIYKGTRCKHDANACRLLHARIMVEEEMDN